MGRDASKSANNVWRIARLEAAKWNDKLNSRAGAAELLNMSEDAVRDTECNMNKHIAFRKGDTIGTMRMDDEEFEVYIGHGEIGCVDGAQKRKFTIIEV